MSGDMDDMFNVGLIQCHYSAAVLVCRSGDMMDMKLW